MICIDEIKYTINRLVLLKANTRDPREICMSEILLMNLVKLPEQAEQIAGSPQFEAEVKALTDAMAENHKEESRNER